MLISTVFLAWPTSANCICAGPVDEVPLGAAVCTLEIGRERTCIEATALQCH